MSSYKIQKTHSLTGRYSEDAVSVVSLYFEQSVSSSFSQIGNDVGTTPQNRVLQLLLDYKLFKAARTIQRFVRGWLCRKMLAKGAAAVTTISRWWRGFRVRQNYYVLMEQRLQKKLLDHYYEQATKIQTLYRGWRTRQFVQDFNGLQLIQLQFAEDLISLLARSLRDVKNNNQLPGVYCLRTDGRCLRIIEDLARTFSYRFHNGRVRASIAKRRSYLEDIRHSFRLSQTYTITPYPGPGAVLGDCTTHVDITEPGFSKETDFRMQRLILMFEKSKRDPDVVRVQNSLASKLRRDIQTSLKAQKEERVKNFCTFVFHRIAPTMDKKHSSLKNYLDELLYNAEEMCCHCQPKLVNQSLCH
ncbi:uncharacterized protein LOC108163991 [Drosophila miranda]|uniref:uncharacterized protein LOC108163991 n=1 Tax=Drosophila miranda TaxID=7229 RepID=UPI0007E7465F|nr:uncharacterized protein LOC108163991 [Drosophila miranda]